MAISIVTHKSNRKQKSTPVNLIRTPAWLCVLTTNQLIHNPRRKRFFRRDITEVLKKQWVLYLIEQIAEYGLTKKLDSNLELQKSLTDLLHTS